ncbi:MAG: SpoIIE family protein phosphatase [Gemmatimonadaceae bacterium]
MGALMPWRSHRTRGLEWVIAEAPFKGETLSGDSHLVRAVSDGVLVAVIDGVGHGEEAARASQRAIEVLKTSEELDLIALVRRCHHALLDTRGVAMSLALLNHETDMMSWLGVGNVAGHVMRSNPSTMPHREVMLTRGGTIGLRLPMLVASTTELGQGDVFLLATDGLKPPLAGRLPLDTPLQTLADELLRTHGRGTDDALVLVGRYLGTGESAVS